MIKNKKGKNKYKSGGLGIVTFPLHGGGSKVCLIIGKYPYNEKLVSIAHWDSQSMDMLTTNVPLKDVVNARPKYKWDGFLCSLSVNDVEIML